MNRFSRFFKSPPIFKYQNCCTDSIFLTNTKVRHISKFTITVLENKELQYYPRFVVASWQNLSNFTNSFRSAESAEIAFPLLLSSFFFAYSHFRSSLQ